MKLTFKGEIIGMNEYINAERSNKFIASKIKKTETERICWMSKKCKPIPKSEYPVSVEIEWYLKDKKKDPDNISYGLKFILDGLVMAKVLENDSQKFIKDIKHFFFIDKKNPRIEVYLI